MKTFPLWFGIFFAGLFFVSAVQASNGAQFISQSVPSSMIPGQTYSVSVTMKNTGTTTWTEANQYRLGAQNPQDNGTWGSFDRVNLTGSESIAPQVVKTFTFNVNAPAVSGTYNFQWRMVQEYVQWFGDYSTNVPVLVADANYISLLSKVKYGGCIDAGLLNAGHSADLINRSSCQYIHRALDTEWGLLDFDAAKLKMAQVTKPGMVYDIFISEGINVARTYYYPDENRNFNFSAMCKSGTTGAWGPNTCVPSYASDEYRKYLRYITRKAIDIGIQTFSFAQVYMGDNMSSPILPSIIAEIKQYAASKGKTVLVGGQTNVISNQTYLRKMDYVIGGLGENDQGVIETGSCASKFSSGSFCWALLYNQPWLSYANNVIIHMDWDGRTNVDADTFAHMSDSLRASFLRSTYAAFKAKGVGFMLPYGIPIVSNSICGSVGSLYTPDNNGPCKDESVMNSILAVTCTDSCSATGAKQCSDTTGYQTCGDYNADTCLEWSSATACAAGQTCSGGICSGGNGKTTYLQILSSGQSLSIYGLGGILTTSQPYNNLMLSPNVEGTSGPLIPLIENYSGAETPSSGMANSLHAYDPLSRPVVVGLHGVGATLYSGLKKGGTVTGNGTTFSPYANGIQQATVTKSLVEANGGIYKPAGVTIIHGESDAGNWAQYEADLKEWQNDYQTDINTLIGGSATLPMFVSQMNQVNVGDGNRLAVAQLSAHKNNPGKIIMVGPKYQYGYYNDPITPANSHLHLTNKESKNVGEMFAKVIKKVAIDGQTWNPLMPTQVTRSGNIITISYAIPVGTLAIDTTNVAQRPNYGFEFAQTGGSSAVSINSAQLVNGNTQVQLTLSGVPDGTDQRVRYAWTCYAEVSNCGSNIDPTYFGGNIRDTDTSVSPEIGSTGIPLYDWGVAFDESVTVSNTTLKANGQLCASASECASNVCSYTYCVPDGTYCGGVVNPMYFANGTTASNQWLSGICRNGVWKTVTNGVGCDSFACDIFSDSCASNRCVASNCTSECSSGAKQCSDTTGYQTCGNYDADTCLEWSSATACAAGQTCSGGICGSSAGYRIPIVVGNTGSSLADYQVKITVPYNSHMKPSFDDVRFTASDGTNLSYWRESYTASAAIFWVKVNSIPAGSSTIYLKYGNASASTASNGADTFVLYDDFNSGDVSNWTLSSSCATGARAANSSVYHSSPYSLRNYFTGKCGAGYSYSSRSFAAPVNGTYAVDFYAKSMGCSGCTVSARLFFNNSQLFSQSISGALQAGTVASSLASGTHTVKVGMYTTNSYSGTFQAYFDDIHVRKTASPAPTYSLGSEQVAMDDGTELSQVAGASAVPYDELQAKISQIQQSILLLVEQLRVMLSARP